jgi:translation elongation factor EF-Tu-like GTPase
MITGTAAMDGAIIVVAASDGQMYVSREVGRKEQS